MYGISGEHYAIDDDVLPILTLDQAVEIRIDIEETGVKLFIGLREYEWRRGCPDVCSVRTGLYSPLNGPQREDSLTHFEGLSGSIFSLTASACRFVTNRSGCQ